MEIRGKAAIVTGASYGIGLATAKRLSELGAKVVLAARSADRLKKIEKELTGSFAVPTDMRNEKDIKDLVDATVRQFGRIDVLINNAGRGMYGPMESVDLEKYKEMMELNVYGPLRAMELVTPLMRAQGGGTIVNVSSRVSKNHFPNLAAYASTKYALNALSLTAREELAKDNIVVSVIYPKMTATDFGKNAFRTAEFQNLRPGERRPRAEVQIDTPEAVAEKIVELIRSEAAEAEM